jgi:uncharacterized membrane protein
VALGFAILRSDPSAVAEAVATLPEPDRTTLGHLLEQRRAEAETIWNGLRQQRAAASEALSAEPYDPDKAAAALAAMSDEFKELRGVVQGTILEIMPKLSAEQRRKMFERRDALWRL